MVYIFENESMRIVRMQKNQHGSRKMEFYNVKARKTVTIADAKCEKVVYSRETSKGIQKRYAVRAVGADGAKLTKFISKETFDSLACPTGKPAKK